MAFSWSEERDIQPISISYSSSTSPPQASPPPYIISPEIEETVVDEDAIERWLTSPVKTESSNADIFETKHVNNLPRQRLANVTARRRRQKMQQRLQPSQPRLSQEERPNETLVAENISPRTSLGRSSLSKKLERNSNKNCSSSNSIVTDINFINNPECCHQTAAKTMTSTEKASRRYSHLAKPVVIESSSPTHIIENDDISNISALAVVVSDDEEEIREFDPIKAIDNKYDEKNNRGDLTMTAQVATAATSTTPITSQKDESDGEKKNSDQSDASNMMPGRLNVKVGRLGITSPGIAAIRHRRRQKQRLRRRETEKEMQKEHQQELSLKSTETMAINSDTKESTNALPSDADTNNVQISPLVSSCEFNDIHFHGGVIENKVVDNDKASANLESNTVANSKRTNDANDKLTFSISHTKKIHLLKRHGAGRGGSAVSKIEVFSAGEIGGVDIDLTPPLQNNTNQVTIHSNENNGSKTDRDQIILRQKSDENGNCTREHIREHEQRSLRPAVDDSPPVGNYHPSCQHFESELEEKISFQSPHRQQQQQPNPIVSLLDSDAQGLMFYDDEDYSREHHIDCDKSKFNTSSKINNDTSVNTSNNITNTRRIKEALARAKSHRIFINKCNANIDNNPRTHGVGSNSEMMMENHLSDGSIACSSVVTLSASTISVANDDSGLTSNNSQIIGYENTAYDDDEVTTIISDNLNPSEGEYAMEISGHERNQSQEYLNTSLFGSCTGKSAIATLVEATVGASSTLIRKSPERQQQQMQVRGKTSRIKLHVYDLVADDTQLDLWGCHFPLGQVFNAFNSSLHSIGTGAYHVGLEINGTEFAYGANKTKGLTGIFACIPKCSPGYQFRTTIDFENRVVLKKSNNAGDTREEVVDGRMIVREMATEYIGTDYDLLRKNCFTFAHDVCIRLGICEEEIPSWFHNLAAAGAVTQDAAQYTLAPITQLFSGSELHKFDEYLNQNSFSDKLEGVRDGSYEEKRNHESFSHTAYQF